jgi:hypothetical protein
MEKKASEEEDNSRPVQGRSRIDRMMDRKDG